MYQECRYQVLRFVHVCAVHSFPCYLLGHHGNTPVRSPTPSSENDHSGCFQLLFVCLFVFAITSNVTTNIPSQGPSTHVHAFLLDQDPTERIGIPGHWRQVYLMSIFIRCQTVFQSDCSVLQFHQTEMKVLFLSFS